MEAIIHHIQAWLGRRQSEFGRDAHARSIYTCSNIRLATNWVCLDSHSATFTRNAFAWYNWVVWTDQPKESDDSGWECPASKVPYYTKWGYYRLLQEQR